MSRGAVSELIGSEDLLGPARQRFAAEQAERSMPIGAWADANLVLPRGDGPTPHRQTVTPYFRHWHAMVQARLTGVAPAHDPTAPFVEQTYLVAAAQIGKTGGYLLPAMAWIVATRPRMTGMVLPSHDAAKQYAKDKIAGIFDNSPRLSSLLPAGQAAREKRTLAKAWRFDRMTMFFLNGAVALDLRQRDLPLLLLDEFDALPVNVDHEGSPLSLALKRQETFPADRLLAGITTPTVVDSLGWSTLCLGSHERLLVACQGCGAHQYLDPDRLEPAAAGLTITEIRGRDRAVWKCAACSRAHTTDQVHAMVAAACAQLGWSAAGGWCPGTWVQAADGSGLWTPDAIFEGDTGRIRAIRPAIGIVRTGWINAAYSRFVTLGAFLANERQVQDQGDAERQAHVNNWRAEPWVARTDSVHSDEVDHVAAVPAEAKPGYQFGQCPIAGGRLVLSCDQQGSLWERSWFPWILRLWFTDGTSWLVDAGKAKDLHALELLAGQQWPVGGAVRKADLITIDSANGGLVRRIREWCAREPRRRMSIGGSGSFAPDVAFSVTESNQRNAQRLCGLPAAWYYNADLFRDTLFDRIRGVPGAPAWHIPSDAPEWYRNSLTSEERVMRDLLVRGRRERRAKWQKRAWTDTKGVQHTREDNHWWDCETQSIAACTVLGWFNPPKQPQTSRPLT